MYVIGLTGMIAAGKSTVSAMLRQEGIPVIDADEISHDVILRGKPAYDEIVAYFGTKLLRPDGEIDRRALGAVIFADAAKREALNRMVHPRVIAEIHAQLKAQNGVVVLDVPLLVQAGLDRICHEIWNVTAPAAVREARIMARDGLSREAAQARIASQDGRMPEDRPVYDLENAGDRTELAARVKELLQRVDAYEEQN